MKLRLISPQTFDQGGTPSHITRHPALCLPAPRPHLRKLPAVFEKPSSVSCSRPSAATNEALSSLVPHTHTFLSLPLTMLPLSVLTGLFNPRPGRVPRRSRTGARVCVFVFVFVQAFPFRETERRTSAKAQAQRPLQPVADFVPTSQMRVDPHDIRDIRKITPCTRRRQTRGPESGSMVSVTADASG